MTEQEQRIAIAEVCGWKRLPELQNPNSLWDDVAIARAYNNPARLPDYLHDLNAMHEVEKTIPGFSSQSGEYHKYRWELSAICQRDASPHVSATAAQRAEAFQRAKGLWKKGV